MREPALAARQIPRLTVEIPLADALPGRNCRVITGSIGS